MTNYIVRIVYSKSIVQYCIPYTVWFCMQLFFEYSGLFQIKIEYCTVQYSIIKYSICIYISLKEKFLFNSPHKTLEFRPLISNFEYDTVDLDGFIIDDEISVTNPADSGSLQSWILFSE